MVQRVRDGLGASAVVVSLSLLVFSFPACVSTKEPRVAIVDVQYAFQHSPLGMASAMLVRKSMGGAQRDLKKRGRSLAELRQQLEHGSFELNAFQRQEIETLIQAEIARDLGIPVSTVSKHLKREGVGRIWRLEEEQDPPRRYEHAAPGDLLHIDAKKLARIEAVGHRIHGDRSRKHKGAGYEVAFVCVDDHTRLAYAEIDPSENARYATLFMRRALKWFRSLGIRPKRLLRDNAKCYSSNSFTAMCDAESLRQSFTRPYTPQTNGKAERFIQTLKRRWAYRYVFRTSAMRAASLRPWITKYNHDRPHRSLGKKTPMQRLRQARQQAV